LGAKRIWGIDRSAREKEIRLTLLAMTNRTQTEESRCIRLECILLSNEDDLAQPAALETIRVLDSNQLSIMILCDLASGSRSS